MASGVPIDYSKVAAEADAAVKGIKDPELRKIAFEKILEDLLSSAASFLSCFPSADPPVQ